MMLFDMPPVELVLGAGIAVIVFFLLGFAAIAFLVYRLLKQRKK